MPDKIDEPEKLTVDLCSKVHDMAANTPEPELCGYMITLLRSAAQMMENRMIESGRVTKYVPTATERARQIALHWLEKPEVLDQLAASLNEEAENWPAAKGT
jgi:hypothetical protein